MAGLPDMSYIRRRIPIVDVATSLGIRIAGQKAAHCWRDGAHQNGDRTPSLSFHRNRAKCFVCDADSLSPIDLVMKYQECSLPEAAAWISGRWKVPTIAKNKKLSRPERWKTSRVGVSAFPLEEWIRSGGWAVLDDAARAVLPVLFCFAENGEVAISYRAVCRYSGKTSNTTIAKVLKYFVQVGFLKALPKTGNNFREVGRYRFTSDSPGFLSMLSDVNEHMKAEIDLERKLRSELKEAASTPTPTPYVAPYPGTTLSTTVDYEGSAHYTAVECALEKSKDSSISRASVQGGRGVENKATCSTPQFSSVDCEDGERSTRMPEPSCYTHKGRAVWWTRPDGSPCCELCHPDPQGLGLKRKSRDWTCGRDSVQLIEDRPPVADFAEPE